VSPRPDASLLRDRFRGTLLGLAAGEALGTPAEFLTAEQVVEKYGVITEMTGGGVYDLAPGEVRMLEDACREADLIAAMEAAWIAEGQAFTARGSQGQVVAHPVVSELRQHRGTLRQILVGLKLPHPDDEVPEREESGPMSGNPRGRHESSRPPVAPMSRQDSARVAAYARWHRKPARGQA